MTSERSHLVPVGVVLAAAALFGTTGTALAKGPTGTDPLAAGSIRLLVGGVGLCLVARSSLVRLRSHVLTSLAGALAVAVYQLGFFDATRRTGVALATMVTIAVSPLASRFLAALRGRPGPRSSWYVAALLIGVGLLLLIGFGSTGLRVEPFGVLAAVAAGCGYALYTEVGSLLIERDVPSTAVMATLFTGGGIVASPVLVFRDVDWLATRAGFGMMAWLALVTLTLAYVGFGWGLRVLAPTTVVMLTLLEPAVAAVLAVTVLDESLSAVGWIGAAIIVMAMPLVAASARSTVPA